MPVKNGTHSKPERVVSVGFLCFILLNFSLIAAQAQQHFKSYDSTKTTILLSTLRHLILVQYKCVCAVVCSVLLYAVCGFSLVLSLPLRFPKMLKKTIKKEVKKATAPFHLLCEFIWIHVLMMVYFDFSRKTSPSWIDQAVAIRHRFYF